MRKSSIGNPIGYGIVIKRSVCYKTFLIEIDALNDRQRVGRSCEEQRDNVRIWSFDLEQMLILTCFQESIEHQGSSGHKE